MPERIFLRLTSTEWVAILTFVLACIAVIQVFVYYLIHETTKNIERAYVSLSHDAPGVMFGVTGSSSEDPINKQDVIVKMKIRNTGSTPALVTRVLIQPIITVERLPSAITYDESFGESINASLAKGTQIDVPRVFHLPTSEIRTVRSIGNIMAECKRPWRLFIIGYVDYIDRFNAHHRSGYARMYNEWAEVKGVQPDDPRLLSPHEIEERHKRRNNLVFEIPPGYNYDRERPRRKGEGYDWNDPTEPSEQ